MVLDFIKKLSLFVLLGTIAVIPAQARYTGPSIPGVGSPGSGDVTGPAVSVDNNIVRFDGTTGKLIQSSDVTIEDDGSTLIDTTSSAAFKVRKDGASGDVLKLDTRDPTTSGFIETLLVTAGGGPIAGSANNVLALSGMNVLDSGTQTENTAAVAGQITLQGSASQTGAGKFLRGGNFTILDTSTGTKVNLIGLNNSVRLGSATDAIAVGNVTNAYGYRSFIGYVSGALGTGSITNSYGVNVLTPQNTDINHTIGTNYGIKVENQTATGITTSYALKTGTGLVEFGDTSAVDVTSSSAFVVRKAGATGNVVVANTNDPSSAVATFIALDVTPNGSNSVAGTAQQNIGIRSFNQINSGTQSNSARAFFGQIALQANAVNSSDITGFHMVSVHNSTGTNATMRGGLFRAALNSAAAAVSLGTTTLAQGIEVQVRYDSFAGTGTVTQANGILVKKPTTNASNTITTNYGILVEDQRNTGIGTAFALQTGTGDVSFGDNLRFTAGTAVSAASYQIGRDNAGTNQLFFNAPSSTSMYMGFNAVPRVTLTDTITGNHFNISGANITSGFALNINDANSLTTGAIARFLSNSADSSGRNLVFIRNQNAAAVATTPLTVQQDAPNTTAVFTQNANGRGIQIDSLATSQNSLRFNTTAQTTGSIISVPNADSLTAGGIANWVSNSADATGRNLIFMRNQNAAATGAVVFRVQQDSTNAAFIADRSAVSSTNPVFTINDSGTGSGRSLQINKSGGSYANGFGMLDIGRTGNYTGVNGETAAGLSIKPNFTMTEPGAGSFNEFGAIIDMTNVAVTAGAGSSTVAALALTAGTDPDAGNNYALLSTGSIIISNGFLQHKTQNVTVADNAIPVTPATSTITPTSGNIQITCQDPDGCTMTMAEPAGIDGSTIRIVNMSANVANFADTAGVTELAGAYAMGQYDTMSLTYNIDRWTENSRSNN